MMTMVVLVHGSHCKIKEKLYITANDDFDGDFWFQLLQDQDSLQVSSNIADQNQDSAQRRIYSSLPDIQWRKV